MNVPRRHISKKLMLGKDGRATHGAYRHNIKLLSEKLLKYSIRKTWISKAGARIASSKMVKRKD